MIRYISAGFGILALLVGQSVSQYTSCSEDLSWLSDGFCDSATNNPDCGYDGGDCCECTCVDGPRYSCGVIGFNCLDPACPDEEASPYPNCTGNFNWLNDGWCEPELNTPACGYDGGDCCACTCMDGPTYSCGSNGFNCDDTACLNVALAIQYPKCAEDKLLSVGDGLCTAENNNQACGYDGGDCCLCTCSGSACDISEFHCLDSSAGDEIHDCKLPPPTSVPCSADAQRVWVVENSAQARALAEAMNCFGGSFDVFWRGEVVVEETIFVFNGTVLNVTGAGSIASMDGNSTTRPLTVVNASVSVTGVNMSYGAGTVGGAIAAVRSSLTLTDAHFVSNTATGHGGAVYVSDNSVVSFVGQNGFSGNTAAMDGGAVFVLDSLCTAENVTFFNNMAGDDGGAVMVTESSSLFWSGKAVYYGNRAGGAGGAISAQYGSDVYWSTAARFQSNSALGSAGALALESESSASWHGDTTFDNNSALRYAGAAHVLHSSYVSWNATTTFSNNRASFDGGAMRVANSSSASLSGVTKFVANGGLGGGAIVVSLASAVVSSGKTSFSANIAENQGGAVFVFDSSIVTWDGDTAFDRNSAGDGGAVHADTSSSLSFAGKTAFRGNNATGVDAPGIALSGGALFVRLSTIAVSGETIFDSNQALGFGGACSLIGAVMLWTGSSSFLNNSCVNFGGAVSMFSSRAVFDANTTFRGNTAHSGGAVDAHESMVAWGGDVEFLYNSAYTGGALGATSNSNITWAGKLTLVHNSAAAPSKVATGGGLSVYSGSSVSWSGNTMFVNNSAHSYGGAIYLSWGATVHWSGDTTFLGCTALFGGSIYVQNGSAVEWSGRTEFVSNKAVYSGGAVGSMFLDEEHNPRCSTLTINGSTMFTNNTAGGTGGGLALNGMLSVEFQSPDVLFIGNSAEGVGGAVFVSSYGVGPVFSAVRFVSNFAGAGGGAYVTGSGNENLDDFEKTPFYATKFHDCQFVDNWATATGGAIETVAGQDHIFNTIFTGNTAAVGGALRLGGKTFLDNCSFVDNSSGEGAGPAVDNIGFVGRITDSSFVGNVFDCQRGTYLDCNESSYALEVACNGCRAPCQGCTFDESLVVPICTQDIQHSTSSGGRTTLEKVSISPGFWRATSTSTNVLACYKDEPCLGGVTGASGYCLDGYEGPYCSICSDGYAASFGFGCEKCSDKAGGIVLTVVAFVFVLVGAAAVASYTMSTKLARHSLGVVGRMTRFLPLQSIKIVIVALQIVTQFTAIANVTYPHVYQRFLDSVNVLNFDLGWISQLSVGCLFDIGIHDRLLIATIGPIIAVLFLGLTYFVATKRIRGSSEALHLIRYKHVSMILLLTFLVYSSVSSILFQMFACDELDDGKNYLRADYRVECDSSEHIAFQFYAGFTILLYTVGIPAFYASLLFRSRRALKDGVGREASQGIQSFSDLWKPYKPSVFYYEVIECGRRVLLTGTVVFIYPNTSAQLAVTLMIAFVFAMISEGLAPFSSRWDTWISRMGHVVVYVSIYVALLLKVDVSNEQSSSQKVFEGVLVAAHLGMILGVIIETGVMVCSLSQTVRERILPINRDCSPKVNFVETDE